MIVVDDGEVPYTEEELTIARTLLQARWDAEDAANDDSKDDFKDDFMDEEGNAGVLLIDVDEGEEEEEIVLARMDINQEYADLEAEEAELRSHTRTPTYTRTHT
jgi:hypothetical protein